MGVFEQRSHVHHKFEVACMPYQWLVNFLNRNKRVYRMEIETQVQSTIMVAEEEFVGLLVDFLPITT